MDERQVELFWQRAERWVNDCGFEQFRRARAVLCPVCAILPLAGTFLVHGVPLALCLPCARELTAAGTRRLDDG